MTTRPNQTLPAVRAGIYTRISWDPGGQRAGVERQRVDCETLCAERGWEVAQYSRGQRPLGYSGSGGQRANGWWRWSRSVASTPS